jgi:hypothetical protein
METGAGNSSDAQLVAEEHTYAVAKWHGKERSSCSNTYYNLTYSRETSPYRPFIKTALLDIK